MASRVDTLAQADEVLERHLRAQCLETTLARAGQSWRHDERARHGLVELLDEVAAAPLPHEPYEAALAGPSRGGSPSAGSR